MPGPLDVVLHHSEPIDPTLWEWLSTKIDDVLGIPAGAMIFLLGTLIVVCPIIIAVTAFKRRRDIER